MRIHLVDGTYELFRAYYGAPAARAPSGCEVGATRALVRTLAALLRQDDVTHVACAFDTVIESFRNELFDGYKTGAGIEPALLSQFSLAERATRAMGIVTWSMVEYEADDGLATAAARWARAPGVEQIVICTPDKDLAQCVQADRVVLLDRRRKIVLDEDGVVEKYGVRPASIPDWLALVGDSADGIPGIPRWGAKSSARVLERYLTIDAIPDDAGEWDIEVRGARALAAELRAGREDAMLYRRLATLRRDVPLLEALDDLRWRGWRESELRTLCAEIGLEDYPSVQ